MDIAKMIERGEAGIIYKQQLKKFEIRLFHEVLIYARGNESRAAGLLGINRGTFRRKLQLYQLNSKIFKKNTL